jgi:hypothetical protein
MGTAILPLPLVTCVTVLHCCYLQQQCYCCHGRPVVVTSSHLSWWISSSAMWRCVIEHLVLDVSKGHGELIFDVRHFKMTPLRSLETSAAKYPVTHCQIAEELGRLVCVSLICWRRSVLQATYRDATMGSGLMEPEGEGRPLLSLQDLESRLVFTRCKVSAGRVHQLLLNSVFVRRLTVKIKGRYWFESRTNSRSQQYKQEQRGGHKKC